MNLLTALIEYNIWPETAVTGCFRNDIASPLAATFARLPQCFTVQLHVCASFIITSIDNLIKITLNITLNTT